MSWLQQIFNNKKPIIAMCHMPPLPGDPRYDNQKGIGYVVQQLRHDIHILQNEGVDALLFSNEFSMPYMLHSELITVAAMAMIIGELKSHIHLPFGIDYMFDTRASVDLAAVTGACFVRGVLSGTYASDFGMWNTGAGDIIRHIYNRRLENKVGVFYSLFPQGATALDNRNFVDIIKSIQFHMFPDAICIPSNILQEFSVNDQLESLNQDEKCAIIIDGGCNPVNISTLLPNADGAIVGTAFKKDGKFENSIDDKCVQNLMAIVKQFSYDN